MGIFNRLFAKIFSQATTPPTLPYTHTWGDPKNPRKSQQPDDTGHLADIKARIEAETAASFASLKQQIHSTKTSVLGSVEEQFRRAMEAMDEGEKRRAEMEKMNRQPWWYFVHAGIPMVNGHDFDSSNVERVHYEIDHSSLFIEYYTGWLYRYWPVNEREAASIFHSRSKGVWVWDNLRRRGTKLGHRKNYQLVGGSGSETSLPRWTRTSTSQHAHDEQVAAESGATGPVQVLGLGNVGPSTPYNALGKFAMSAPKMNIGNKQTAKQVLAGNIKPTS